MSTSRSANRRSSDSTASPARPRARRPHSTGRKPGRTAFHPPDEYAMTIKGRVARAAELFAQALRRALRQDPDVSLVGELRDAETAQTALQAAESGHLVLSTLH